MEGTAHFQLNPGEDKILEQFRELVQPLLQEHADQKLVRQALANDIVLTRFLRARQHNLEKAKEMFSNTLTWRKENRIDDIANEQFPFLPKFRRMVPASFHKFDRIGRPVLLDWSGKLVGDELFKHTSLDDLLRLHINQMEFLYDRLFDLANQNSNGQPIYQLVTVLDLEGLKKKHINKQAHAFLKQAARIDQDNYPELLGRSIIVNPPLIFKMVWKLVRPFLDDRTKAKISVVRGKKSVNKALAELIAPTDLPARYAGTCDCGGCFSGGSVEEVEYWQYTLGIADQAAARTAIEESCTLAQKEEAAREKELKKKKKRGFFGRKKQDSSEDEAAEEDDDEDGGEFDELAQLEAGNDGDEDDLKFADEDGSGVDLGMNELNVSDDSGSASLNNSSSAASDPVQQAAGQEESQQPHTE